MVVSLGGTAASSGSHTQQQYLSVKTPSQSASADRKQVLMASKAKAGKYTTSSWLSSREEDIELRQMNAALEDEARRFQAEKAAAGRRLGQVMTALGLVKARLSVESQIALELTLWYWSKLAEDEIIVLVPNVARDGTTVIDSKTGLPLYVQKSDRFDAAASVAGYTIVSLYGDAWVDANLDELARVERIAKAVLGAERAQRTRRRIEAKSSPTPTNMPTPATLVRKH